MKTLMLLSLAALTTSKSSAFDNHAFQTTSKAVLMQTGLDKELNELYKQYTPEIVRKYGGDIAFIKAVVVDQRISYKWTWP